jgi:hypothetical protein
LREKPLGGPGSVARWIFFSREGRKEDGCLFVEKRERERERERDEKCVLLKRFKKKVFGKISFALFPFILSEGFLFAADADRRHIRDGAFSSSRC